MSYLNEISAGIALVLMALVLIGLAPYVRIGRNLTKYDLIRLSVFMVSGLTAARLIWWDLLRQVLGALDVMPPVIQSTAGQIINTGFNVWAALAALTALAALHRSLPIEHQKDWNWLNTPFYPGRLFNTWRS